MLLCQHPSKGYIKYKCAEPLCGGIKIVHFNCNGKLCTNCGKKQTDKWASKVQRRLFPVTHRHVVFTMPDAVWKVIEKDKKLIDVAFRTIPIVVTQAFDYKYKNKGLKIKPGIFAVLHTYGEDLKFNVHFHTLTTQGGITQYNQWKNAFVSYESLRKVWQYHLLTRLKEAMSKTRENNIFIHRMFKKYPNGFYVRAKDRTPKEKHKLIKYLARYVRHPAIAQSRITSYDGNTVTFICNKHTSEAKYVAMDVDEFITAILNHLPDKNYHLIRYQGIYCNNKRKYFSSIICRFKQTMNFIQKKLFSTRPRCQYCGRIMIVDHIEQPTDPPAYLVLKNYYGQQKLTVSC
jgi:hypothetical protein